MVNLRVLFIATFVMAVFGNINHDLINATTRGDLEGVEKSLSSGGNPHWRSPDNQGSTILHFAAALNHSAIVSSLLNSGADIEVRDDFRITPLQYASVVGSTDSLATLIAHGADVNNQAFNGDTALIAATQSGHLNIVNT
ncbi:unnamed protein product, partial [Meganyctiphanes norvegica]